jgi:hypothetical protein
MQTDEEKYLIDAIKIQQERYELAIRPYVERLTKIRSMKVPVVWMDNKTREVYFDTSR